MQVRQVFAAYDRKADHSADSFKYCPYCQTPLHLAEQGGKARPTCSGCGFIQFKNPAPTISIVILDGNKVLLGKRGGPPGKNKWSFPSGYVEWEDDFLSTAIREAKEETGLDVEIQSVINIMSSFLSPGWHFLSLFVQARAVGGERLAGDDLLKVEWFCLADTLPDMAFEEDVAILEMVMAGEYRGLPIDPEYTRGR